MAIVIDVKDILKSANNNNNIMCDVYAKIFAGNDRPVRPPQYRTVKYETSATVCGHEALGVFSRRYGFARDGGATKNKNVTKSIPSFGNTTME